MTVTVKHAKTNAISDWTQAQLDEQISLGNFAPGTTLANIVLPSDWNNDHTLTGIGTMAEQNANNVAITGGTINNASIGATTASTGKFTSVTTPSVTASSTDLTLSAISTGAVKFNTLGGLQAQVSNTASSVNYVQLTGGATNVPVAITSQGSDADIGLRLSSFGAAALRLFTNNLSTEQARVSHTASAVNYVQVTGATTGNAPVISAQGSDTNSTLAISSKGTGAIRFDTGGATAQFRVLNTASAVNRLDVTGSATGFAVQSVLSGTDTNISMAFQPKGTGAIDLAAGSSGVNISNGGTVTAITRTATGSGYTSFPTVTVSPPTTAGGVQAIVTQASMAVGAVAINNGGTGYTVNDVLTVTGGTSGNCTITVTSVSAGVITGVSFTTTAPYTVLPTNPVSVTGGTGTSATFNLTYGISGVFTISNAGSGYIEQPTVSFSGGGGSGASAYATVGGDTTIRSLGTNMNFYASNQNIAFRVYDSLGAGNGYWAAQGGASNPFLWARGGTNTQGNITSSGTGGLVFYTNGGSQTQFVVSHTASAVNYVQVTGAPTTGASTISAQGSDANTSLYFVTKGTGSYSFWNNGGTTYRNVRIDGSIQAVNYLDLYGNIASNAPSVRVGGSDTNIDLALTPKGTGRVKFGTYTANMALTVQGYIEILDSGGTIRKLAVIA